MPRWQSMTREEFDHEYAESFRDAGMLYPWRLLTWKERVVRVVMISAAIPAGLVALAVAMTIIGSMVDGVAERAEDFSRCQKNAATPYDYHQCR